MEIKELRKSIKSIEPAADIEKPLPNGMDPLDAANLIVDFKERTLEMGWVVFQKLHPGIKGVERLKAKTVFSAAWGIFQSVMEYDKQNNPLQHKGPDDAA